MVNKKNEPTQENIMSYEEIFGGNIELKNIKGNIAKENVAKTKQDCGEWNFEKEEAKYQEDIAKGNYTGQLDIFDDEI